MGSRFRRLMLFSLTGLSLGLSGFAFSDECNQCEVAAVYVRPRPSSYRSGRCSPYYRYYPYPAYYYRYSTEYYHMRYPYSYDTHPHWWWYGGGANIH